MEVRTLEKLRVSARDNGSMAAAKRCSKKVGINNVLLLLKCGAKEYP